MCRRTDVIDDALEIMEPKKQLCLTLSVALVGFDTGLLHTLAWVKSNKSEDQSGDSGVVKSVGEVTRYAG